MGAGRGGALVGRGPTDSTSLEVGTDRSKEKGAETHVPSSEVGITIYSTEQGRSLLGKCPKESGTGGRWRRALENGVAILGSSEDHANMTSALRG